MVLGKPADDPRTRRLVDSGWLVVVVVCRESQTHGSSSDGTRFARLLLLPDVAIQRQLLAVEKLALADLDALEEFFLLVGGVVGILLGMEIVVVVREHIGSGGSLSAPLKHPLQVRKHAIG